VVAGKMTTDLESHCLTWAMCHRLGGILNSVAYGRWAAV